jgi:MreB/Mbl protein
VFNLRATAHDDQVGVLSEYRALARGIAEQRERAERLPQAAEAITLAVGSAARLAEELVADVRGLDLEARSTIEGPLSEIRAAVQANLEETSPELACDLARDGSLLAGGGSVLRGFAERRGRDRDACASGRWASRTRGGRRALVSDGRRRG